MSEPAMIGRLRVVIHVPGNSLERDAFQHKLGPNEAPSPTTKPSRRLELRKKQPTAQTRNENAQRTAHHTDNSHSGENPRHQTPGHRPTRATTQRNEHTRHRRPSGPITLPRSTVLIELCAMYARTTLGMCTYTIQARVAQQ